MPYADLPAPLQRFVTEMNELLATAREEIDLLPKVAASMRGLIDRDDWLEPALAQAHPKHYQQYLLYADPDDRFSVVSFVWGPRQETPIHDHTVWGVIGMLRGAEVTQRYQIAADGGPEPIGEEIVLMPGAVGFVSPRIGDVHKVRNVLDEGVSISIHAYGANIGKIERHVFPSEGGAPKPFVSGYSKVQA